MALFTLTDINFGDDRRNGSTGPLVGSQYESNTYRFPLDIGNYNRGHYIVIHINVQEQTNYNFTTTNDDPTIIANRKNYNTPSINTNFNKGLQGLSDVGNAIGSTSLGQTFSSALSGVSSLFSSINEYTGISNAIKNYGRIEGARTIKRTTDTIALYMPDTVNFVTNQTFAELQMTGMPAAALAAGASAVDAKASGGELKDFTKNMTPFVASYFLNNQNLLGGLGQQMFAASYGVVQNPMLDVIYSSPQFRTFNFEFMFYPKSEKEAEQLLKVINRLQFHQAPEIKKEYNGFFLVPPSEFDIKFYYNGSENPNIQKMSTCVLESINIDYAPNGYTAYEVPGQTKPTFGGTGMPVAIRMNLQFKELEVLTKSNFKQDDTCITQNAIDAAVSNIVRSGWGAIK